MLVDERTTVGLDVHARSVVAEAVDWSTGETFSRRLTPAPAEVLAWVWQLPGAVAVTYEAGPTGFGLARAFAAAGIGCEVVAPSKLQRPPGDRVKTDRRDARRLARLLHIGEISGIRVPTVAGEPGHPGHLTVPGTTGRPQDRPVGDTRSGTGSTRNDP